MKEPTTTTTRNDGKRLETKFAAWLKEVQQFDRAEPKQRVNGAVSTEIMMSTCWESDAEATSGLSPNSVTSR